MFHSSFSRLLAIDPTSKGFGFVALEGAERLIDWGLVDLHGKRSNLSGRLLGLLRQTDPQMLVVEALNESRRGDRAREVIAEAKSVATDRGISVQAVSRAEVSEHFGTSASSKDRLAERLSEIFPDLGPILPPKRRAWMARDDRMAVFDALSLAVTVLWGEFLG